MTLQPLIMHTDGLCRTDNLASVLPPTDQLISIDQPVGSGFKAKNLDRDVRTIQESLNKIKPAQGGPAIPLVVDGKIGPKTNKAITDFQFKQFGIKGADGVIEPGKQTIQRINQILFSNLPIKPGDEAQIRGKLVSHLGLVAQAIHAAQANLMMASAPAGGLDLGRGRANQRVDNHFALDTLQPAQRDKAIRDILAVFNLYQQCLLLPPELDLGFLGSGAFVTDPTGDPRIAFAFANGFFRKGEKDPERNIPRDRIYLGRRAFFALSDGEFCAFIMLHEMAHFVGFPDKSFIVDNGRGWFTDDTIKSLNADKRLHNADSYATFATECRTGSAAKPAYVKAANNSR
jgi:peptidoglycan hydrolase-like protein with peptidoglycan-binding domain